MNAFLETSWVLICACFRLAMSFCISVFKILGIGGFVKDFVRNTFCMSIVVYVIYGSDSRLSDLFIVALLGAFYSSGGFGYCVKIVLLLPHTILYYWNQFIATIIVLNAAVQERQFQREPEIISPSVGLSFPTCYPHLRRSRMNYYFPERKKFVPSRCGSLLLKRPESPPAEQYHKSGTFQSKYAWPTYTLASTECGTNCRYFQLYHKVMLSTHSSPDRDLPSSCSKNVLRNLAITQQKLELWCERLRDYISGTILMPVVKTIEEVNQKFLASGYTELQIGVLSIFSLKQLAFIRRSEFPMMLPLIPYLELSLNQEYLVKRLKDLSFGGYLRGYKHDSGGCYGGNEWTKELPTDSSIVLHLFCTYLDSLMPFDNFFEKKPFTNKHFKKAFCKPEAESKNTFFIYQSRKDPPYFCVAINGEMYEVPKGRNNLFYAILVFLQHVKLKESGRISQLIIGPSGLNVSWVLE